MDCNERGKQTEAIVLLELVKRGYSVLLPFNSERYDLVYEDDGQFVRAQVKTGRFRDGVVLFARCSTTYGRKIYSKSECDVVLVYCPDLDEVYKVPVEIILQETRLRVTPPQYNRVKDVKLASDFVL